VTDHVAGECPDHDEVTVGACLTCQREVCEYCLEEVDDPAEFECPDCGHLGVAPHDHDYGRILDDEV